MSDLASSLRDRVTSGETRKVIKYSMVSVVSVVVTTAVQFFCLFALKLPVTGASFAASVGGAIPSYYLNRTWVWGKSGRSHLRKEVIPFWIMFAIGLGFSIGAADLAGYLARDFSHGARSLTVTAASFTAYGLLWISKYVIFNKVLFAHREQDLDPVLDGRSGLPT